jgi:hypothetical protein
MVYAGKALWRRHRTEAEGVAELAEKNVRISPREVFVSGAAIRRISGDCPSALRPGYPNRHAVPWRLYLHLDATCEGRDPFLMSSIDSLSEIVLGTVKLPAEYDIIRKWLRMHGVRAVLRPDCSRPPLSSRPAR